MSSATRREKIMIVDDNPEILWALIDCLEEEYDVLYATNGEKALSIALSETRLDLILLDIVMPGLDGFEVCARLKADNSTKDIPVIFLTGNKGDEEETKGLELGAQDYITKPFSLPVVRARISSVLNLKKEMDRRLLLRKQLEELNKQLEQQVQAKIRELQEAKETLWLYEEKYRYLFQECQVNRNTMKKILIVDDNPENINILSANLEDDYNIFFATDGETALDIAMSENRPDLILLDIMMPGMDGYEVCSRLKANTDTWDIPVIFITALGQEKDETKGLNLGAVDFINKPFRMAVIKARIKAALCLKEEMDNRMVLTRKLEDLNKNLEKRVHEKTFQLKQAHEDLKASEKRYRMIYENAIEGIFQSVPEGHIINASPALARILGYESSQEVIENNTDIDNQIFVRPEDRVELIRTLKQKGVISGFETQFKKKNGDIIWVMISAKALRNEKDGSVFYQGFCIDITEQKRAKELEMANIRLQELDALKSALLSTASHDIRSPLSCILGYAELINMDFSTFFLPALKGNPTLEDRAQKAICHLEIIEKEVCRLTRLVNDLLDLSKLESDCFDWNDKPVHLNGLIDEAIEAVKSEFLIRPAVELKFVRDQELPPINCDPDRIMQVMINLLSNAAKFTEVGHVVVQALARGGDHIEVRVTDTGPGIPEKEKENIFNKFYQIRQSQGRKGTGLGLAISRQIIEHYHGRIWVESEPGQGSTFIFRLPIEVKAKKHPSGRT